MNKPSEPNRISDDPPPRIMVGGAVSALNAAVEIECIARTQPAQTSTTIQMETS